MSAPLTPPRTSSPSITVTALLPGVVLCAAMAALVLGAGRWLPDVSPLLLAIVLGAVVANLLPLPVRMTPGLSFTAKELLRVGIALLGLQLVLGDLLELGPGMLAVVVAVVGLGVAGTAFLGRLLGLSRAQGLLIACGFSICGAAAVAAADEVVEAEEEEVLTSIALVVIFGTVMIPLVPLLAQAMGLEERQAGWWAGGSIHEVAQVVAAGGVIGGSALTLATAVKLARVMMLAPVITILSARQRTYAAATGAAARRPAVVPLFILGFLICAGLRSTGILPELVLTAAHGAQTALLTAAMFALGTGIRASLLTRVGARPFFLAAAATVWVAGLALIGVLWVG